MSGQREQRNCCQTSVCPAHCKQRPGGGISSKHRLPSWLQCRCCLRPAGLILNLFRGALPVWETWSSNSFFTSFHAEFSSFTWLHFLKHHKVVDVAQQSSLFSQLLPRVTGRLSRQIYVSFCRSWTGQSDKKWMICSGEPNSNIDVRSWIRDGFLYFLINILKAF